MSIQLILLDNIENLGKIGELVNVSDGYARNFLMPRGLAAKATPGAMRQLESRKAQLIARYEAQLVAAREVAAKLNGVSVTIPAHADEEGKLFGSVTGVQIVASLAEMQFEIDKKQVMLSDALRHVGEFDVEIALHQEVSASIKVWIVKN